MRSIYSKLFVLVFSIPLFANCASMLDAVQDGNLVKVKQLTEKGADVNRVQECTAPLVLAAEKGHADVVQYLLSKGADPNLRLPQCEGRHRILGPYRRYGHTALYWSSTPEITKILLEHGADPNLAGTKEFKDGYVDLDLPIVFAFQKVNYEMASLLLSHGANPNVYLRTDGRNILRSIAASIAKGNAEKGQRFVELLDRYKAHDLDATPQAQQRTEEKVMKSYRNNRTSVITSMSEDMAKRLYDNPNAFNEITFDSGQKRYFHDFEFTWVDNGQNMYEWVILRRLYKKNLAR